MNEIQVGKPVVIITGASRGIGFAAVKKFVKNGWTVRACARKESAELIDALGDDGSIHILDLADESSVVHCAKAIAFSEKRIDGLVNCAGIAHGSLFSMTKLDHLQHVFQINLFSQILFSQYIAKKMIRNKSGSIVNVSSTAGILADSGTLAYGSSKAAFSHATRIMATELGAFGIRVNGVAPAKVETDMGRMMDKKSSNLLEQRTSLKGEISADNVADIIYFLASSESKMMSGQIIRLDKGMPF